MQTLAKKNRQNTILEAVICYIGKHEMSFIISLQDVNHCCFLRKHVGVCHVLKATWPEVTPEQRPPEVSSSSSSLSPLFFFFFCMWSVSPPSLPVNNPSLLCLDSNDGKIRADFKRKTRNTEKSWKKKGTKLPTMMQLTGNRFLYGRARFLCCCCEIFGRIIYI